GICASFVWVRAWTKPVSSRPKHYSVPLALSTTMLGKLPDTGLTPPDLLLPRPPVMFPTAMNLLPAYDSVYMSPRRSSVVRPKRNWLAPEQARRLTQRPGSDQSVSPWLI